jgi:hypothetical protein
MVCARQGGVSCIGSDKNKKWTRTTNAKKSLLVKCKKKMKKM